VGQEKGLKGVDVGEYSLYFSLVYYQRYLQHHSNFGSHALASFDVLLGSGICRFFFILSE